MRLATHQQQPAERLLYHVDYRGWLSTGETLSGVVALTAPADASDFAAVATLSSTAGVVQVMVSGGVDGTEYTVTLRIDTSTGQRKEDELVIQVVEL